MVLASSYDQSKWMKATELEEDLTLKIKDVTEEVVGQARRRRRSSACGSRITSRV